MSDQLHSTAAADTPPPAANLANDFKKLIPTLVLAVLTAFITSWWNSQQSQADLQFRLSTVEQKAETNAKNISQNSLILQGNAIRMAESGVIQNNILEQIKDIKQEQNEIKIQLNRK